jgi:hypothetical protein
MTTIRTLQHEVLEKLIRLLSLHSLTIMYHLFHLTTYCKLRILVSMVKWPTMVTELNASYSHVDWCKFYIHLRNLNHCDFKTVEATGPYRQKHLTTWTEWVSRLRKLCFVTNQSDIQIQECQKYAREIGTGSSPIHAGQKVTETRVRRSVFVHAFGRNLASGAVKMSWIF